MGTQTREKPLGRACNRVLRTLSSASITSIRSSRALINAWWACSVFGVFSPGLGSGGASALSEAMAASYSILLDEMAVKVAVIFHGFVE